MEFSKILNAIHEGIKNSFIIDDAGLEIENDSIFQHEETNYNSLQGKMNDNYYHNFLSCKLGDKIYVDPELGYNTKKGEYIGFCCIEAGVMPDNKPRFAYKEDLPERMNWKDAKQKCKEIPNGYLPDKDELQTSFDKGLNLSTDSSYWSSTQIYSHRAGCLYTSYVYINYNDKDDVRHVRPFFHIPQLEDLNESVKQSFIIDDDELETENDSIFQHEETSFDKVNKTVKIPYYQIKLNNLVKTMSSKEDYLEILNIWQTYGIQFIASNDDLKKICHETMHYAGYKCNLNWINTSNVTDIASLFDQVASFNCDVSQWNVSKVEVARSAFCGCVKFNGDISNWSLDSIQDAALMFYLCQSLTTTPKLPQMQLLPNIYDNMFTACKSLTTAPALPAMQLADNCYQWMFSDCSSLVNAPELPAKSLVTRCYAGMFKGCKALEVSPELPALDLAEGCYLWMFMECENLKVTPKLPANQLHNDCYASMFYDCKNLITPPDLLAQYLAKNCYCGMFYSCESLTKYPKLPASIANCKDLYKDMGITKIKKKNK